MPAETLPSRSEPASAQASLAAAWRSWALCVAAPGVWLVYVLVKLPAVAGADGGSAAAAAVGGASVGGGGWLVWVALVWLALAGPVVFVLRSYCFRAAWDGRPVEPESYLKGMGSVWAVLVVGAVLALMGSVLSGQWVPGVLVAGVAVGLVVLTRPDGRALGVSGGG